MAGFVNTLLSSKHWQWARGITIVSGSSSPAFLFVNLYLIIVLWRPQEWLLPILAKVQILDMVAGAALFATFLELKPGTSSRLAYIPHVILMSLTFICALMSHAANGYFAGLQFALTDFSKVALIFVLVVINLNTVARLRISIWIVVVMAMFMAVHCTLQAITGTGFGGARPLVIHQGTPFEYYRSQFFGLFGDPNDTALFLVTTAPLCFFLARRWRAIGRPVLVAALAILCYGIHTTASRGGFMALFFTGGIFIATTFRFKRIIVYGGGFMLALVLLAPARFGIGFMEASASGRIEFWGTANEAFKSHPFFGVGYRMITEYIPGSRATHNSFVQAYAELGMIGYMAWFGLLLTTLIGMWHVSRLVPENRDDDELVMLAKMMVPALSGFYFAAYFISRTYTIPMYLLLGIAAAVYRVAGERVGIHQLNRVCGFRVERFWLIPACTVASIAFIYVNIIVYNSALGR